MYHPPTPGQSWVQSPVSFQMEQTERGIARTVQYGQIKSHTSDYIELKRGTKWYCREKKECGVGTKERQRLVLEK